MRNGNGPKPSEATRPIRCALYTRKSHEEGLDQEFNSLDAQRESTEAYVKSQAQEGWIALPTHYDDGGFSGATMERPAMKRLIEDVEAGKVDCVVVYKVDRLSRSLLDFARLVDLFDRKGVSFVSVTQQFNTTTSMGRLTLNVLLSFAQFEREVIAERIRDKFAASRKRGKHMGGMPVLGYDIDRARKRLVVNPEEAELVRYVFKRFIEEGSTTKLALELNTAGRTTKAWTTVKGKERQGTPWHKGHLYRLLNNPLYIGEVVHKGDRYPGEHEGIIDRKIWEKAQAILLRNYHAAGRQRRTKSPALLVGLVRCVHCDVGMAPTFSIRRGKVYRYYLCMRASKMGAESCPTRRVPATDLEQVVVDQLRTLLRAPEPLVTALHEDDTAWAKEGQIGKHGNHTRGAPGKTQPSLPDEIAIREASGILDRLWDGLFPAERERIVRQVVERVEVAQTGLELVLRVEGLRGLITEAGQGERVGAA